MASIYGIQLKAVKEFRGHEGESLFQGNIYLDNKKIGFFSQGDWGGPYIIRIDNKERETEFKNRVDKYFAKHPEKFADEETLFCNFMMLKDIEKYFKSSVKEGCKAVIFVEESGVMYSTVNYKSTIQKKNLKEGTYVVYTSLNDFIKGED